MANNVCEEYADVFDENKRYFWVDSNFYICNNYMSSFLK